MAGQGTVDYARLTKWSTLASLVLVAVGFGAMEVGTHLLGEVPAWEVTLFTDMEIVGTLGAVLCPFVFGVAMPLTE